MAAPRGERAPAATRRAQAARVQGSRPERVAGWQLGDRAGQCPLHLGRVDAGRHEGARRMGPRAHAPAAMSAPDRQRDGRGHAFAGAGHGAPDGEGEELPQPAGVDADPVGSGLVGEVEGHDHREAQVAAGDDEREVASDVTRIDDDQDRVRGRRQEGRPERQPCHRAVVEGSRARQIDEEGSAGPCPNLADLAAHRGARCVGGLGEPATGPGQERGLAHVGPPDEGDDGRAGSRAAHRGRVSRPPLGGIDLGPNVATSHGGSAASTRIRTATWRAIATRARPRRTTTGPPNGRLVSTSSESPRWRPSAASRSASSLASATTRLRAPTGSWAREINGDAFTSPIPAER